MYQSEQGEVKSGRIVAQGIGIFPRAVISRTALRYADLTLTQAVSLPASCRCPVIVQGLGLLMSTLSQEQEVGQHDKVALP